MAHRIQFEFCEEKSIQAFSRGNVPCKETRISWILCYYVFFTPNFRIKNNWTSKYILQTWLETRFRRHCLLSKGTWTRQILSSRNYIRIEHTNAYIHLSSLASVTLENFIFQFFSVFFRLFDSNQPVSTQIVDLFSNFNLFQAKAAT